jgi:hypothetical protein
MQDREVAQILWPQGHEGSNNAHMHADLALLTYVAPVHLHRTEIGCGNKEQAQVIDVM